MDRLENEEINYTLPRKVKYNLEQTKKESVYFYEINGATTSQSYIGNTKDM